MDRAKNSSLTETRTQNKGLEIPCYIPLTMRLNSVKYFNNSDPYGT